MTSPYNTADPGLNHEPIKHSNLMPYLRFLKSDKIYFNKFIDKNQYHQSLLALDLLLEDMFFKTPSSKINKQPLPQFEQ